MWLTPARKNRFVARTMSAGVTVQCSSSQVKLSDDTSFLPVTWAAEDANLFTKTAALFGVIVPKISVSGMSEAA